MATIADRSDFTLELEFTRIYRENAGEHRAAITGPWDFPARSGDSCITAMRKRSMRKSGKAGKTPNTAHGRLGGGEGSGLSVVPDRRRYSGFS